MKEDTVKIGIFEFSVESDKLKIKLDDDTNKKDSKKSLIKGKKKNIF